MPPRTGDGSPRRQEVAATISSGLKVVISRLLDMPVEQTLFGNKKAYKVRVFDADDKELKSTGEITAGKDDKSPRGAKSMTIAVGPKDGSISCKTESKLLYLQVEFAGAMVGNRPIGRCQIHRMDPRSSQIWPYLLSDDDGEPVDCGIELKIIEGGGASGANTPTSPFATVGSQGAAFGSVPFMPAPMGGASPMAMPESGPMGSRPGSGVVSQHQMPASMQDMHHGVMAMFELENAKDLPCPPKGDKPELTVQVLNNDTQRELKRIGPFKYKEQRGFMGSNNLVDSDFKGARAFILAPLYFGGDAKEGAMFVKVSLSYAKSSNGSLDTIGVTDTIKVDWKLSSKKYYEIKQKGSKSSLGGIYLTHRLITEQDSKNNPNVSMLAAPQPQVPKIGPPIEPYHRVNGRTGNFPPGSQEEAFEQAAINCEAQNRALLQRCKRADPNSHETNPHQRIVNGYREWDHLDDVFATMGPNPLAMSEELGPNVTRSFPEKTSVINELLPQMAKQMGHAMTPADEQLNKQLVQMMYSEDATKEETAMRPVVCKDPDEIAGPRDMRWCPDPPVYAPMRNMHEADKETVRLACFRPEQTAKLMFADANPNYRMNEDIWGVLADYKTAQSAIVPQQLVKKKRVKDDCLMA